MPFLIEIPDEFLVELKSGCSDLASQARELIALELYREGRISLRAMGRLAGVGDDYWSADSFRARHNMPVSGSLDAAEDDLDTFFAD
jgi:hypothetical protein